MRLLIIGTHFVAQWSESVARAASVLGHSSHLVFYDTFTSTRLVRNVSRLFPVASHSILKPLATRLGQGWERWFNSHVVAMARAERPDLILILKGDGLNTKTITALRDLHTLMVTWWVDDPFRFPGITERLSLFDAVYLYDRARWDELTAAGVRRILYLPCACDERIFFPQNLDPATFPRLLCDVALIAAYYPERDVLLRSMQGMNLGLWGPGWEASSGLKAMPAGTWRSRLISPQVAARIYNLATICPNVHHSQTRVGGLNTRTFEVIAAGGFELVDNVPGLEEHFELGTEIVAYSSPEHFRKLADYYLKHPEKRRVIVKNGRARVASFHTYRHRLQTIFTTLPRP